VCRLRRSLKLLQNWGEYLHGKYFEESIASGGGALS
jgi:hypothetical protein